MARLGLRSAGDVAAERVRRFSDELLEVEHEAFAAIDRIAEVRATDGAALLRRRRDARVLLTDQPLFRDLARLAVDVVLATLPEVAVRIDRGIDMGLDSVTDELELCEQTMAKRYVGTANVGVRGAREIKAAMVQTEIDRYEGDAFNARAALAQEITRQLGLVFVGSEDMIAAEARLFSAEPARLPGCSGRGAWWSLPTALNASARAAIIHGTNVAREQAIAGMNDELALR